MRVVQSLFRYEQAPASRAIRKLLRFMAQLLKCIAKCSYQTSALILNKQKLANRLINFIIARNQTPGEHYASSREAILFLARLIANCSSCEKTKAINAARGIRFRKEGINVGRERLMY